MENSIIQIVLMKIKENIAVQPLVKKTIPYSSTEDSEVALVLECNMQV
jgi:hypothetical protein